MKTVDIGLEGIVRFIVSNHLGEDTNANCNDTLNGNDFEVTMIAVTPKRRIASSFIPVFINKKK